MEYQKIINFSENTPNQSTKFSTKNVNFTDKFISL